MPYKRFVHHLGASLAGFAVIVAIALPAAAAQVGITINGSEVDVSPSPIIQAGRVFVPLRGVFERLGASVVYSNRTINATGNGRDISLHIGSNQAFVNGQSETIDVAPFIIGSSTFVPLRFVSQALGATVNWDDTDRVVAIETSGGQTSASNSNVPSYAEPAPNEDYASNPPPPIPSYAQPAVPEPNLIWQPGYWALGPYGYYWVPGTWVEPPQPGYLWTPGYWRASGVGFAFSPGYWALSVGFYGGINYGFGYFGQGFYGGRWDGDAFRYNTAVTNVNETIIHNTYVDRTVVINNDDAPRKSYNGGPDGVRATPGPGEVSPPGNRLPPTKAQLEHAATAAQDRGLLASVNHNTPPVVTVPRPLTENNRPEGFEPVSEADRAGTLPGRDQQGLPPVRTETPETPETHDAAPVFHTPEPIVHPDESQPESHSSAPDVHSGAPEFHSPSPQFHSNSAAENSTHATTAPHTYHHTTATHAPVSQQHGSSSKPVKTPAHVVPHPHAS
jgi:hypothetical protein